MERDFEREFRELKQNEIPDLWNRIEAGLSEKKNMASVQKNVIAIDNGYSAERRRFGKNDFERETIKKQFVWRKWGTLIAACVCVVIILPALSLFIRSKGYSGSRMDTSSGAVEEIACDNSAMETAAEEAEAEAGVTEATTTEDVAEAAEEPADNMAADADCMTDSTGAADAGGYDAASTNEVTAENAQIQKNEEVKETESREEKAAWDDLEDGQILEAVVIQIQNVETAGTEAVCQAAVWQGDADNVLDGGTQIAIVCDDETVYDFPRGPRDGKELKEQETYQVTLRYDAEEGSFVVLTVERWEG